MKTGIVIVLRTCENDNNAHHNSLWWFQCWSVCSVSRVWVCLSPFSRLIQAAVLQTPLFLPEPHSFLASNPMFGWLNPSNANLHVCVGFMAWTPYSLFKSREIPIVENLNAMLPSISMGIPPFSVLNHLKMSLFLYFLSSKSLKLSFSLGFPRFP